MIKNVKREEKEKKFPIEVFKSLTRPLDKQSR